VVLITAALLAAVGIALDFGSVPDAWSFGGILVLFVCYAVTAVSLHRRRPESEADLSVPAIR
jgi:hypothetical protein